MRLTEELPYQGLVKIEEFIPRANTQGLHYTDIVETLRRIKDDETWVAEWCQTASAHESLARKALGEHRHITAGQAFYRASLCYHFAQLLYFGDIRFKLNTVQKMVECYRQGMNFFVPPAEAVNIPFEGKFLAAYFRRPSNRTKSPCVMIIGGADSTKHEYHHLENQFLCRGMATLSFDGPGQGETWPNIKLRSDFEKATSAVVDFLSTHSAIDANRIGVLGVSFGGHLSVRSASSDPRIKACISLGGFYDTSYYNWEDPLRRIRFQHLCGTKDIAEAKRVAKEFDLSGLIHKMKASLLVVHGLKDNVTPPPQAERIYSEAPGQKWKAFFEEGNHCCHNIPHKTHSLMADWSAEILKP